MGRKSLLLISIGIALLCTPIIGNSAASEHLIVETYDGVAQLTRYAADVSGRRPAVLIFAGARGIELKSGAYKRYVDALTKSGLDVYLVGYYTALDSQELDPRTSTRESRDSYTTRRFPGWAKRISSIVTTILARADCSGSVGLLGFSLGGFVAANSAASDERVKALVVMYGGMPNAMVEQVKHLPPLLEMHGEADRIVPLEKGEELVQIAHRLGAEAKLVTYPGRPHGFDFTDSDPMTADAIQRTLEFFETHLASPP